MNWKLHNIGYTVGLLLLVVTSCKHQGKHTAVPSAALPDRQSLMEVNKQLTEKDKDIIEAFIRRKQWNMEFYADGYYGMIIEEGRGPLATEGTTVKMRCIVKLLDGTVCYENQLHEFVVGKSVEIAGLHRVAMHLRQGAKARFIFPPHLAYGLAGDRDKIGPRNILLYDIEVIKSTA